MKKNAQTTPALNSTEHKPKSLYAEIISKTDFLLLKTALIFTLICICTACYKMPTDDDCSVIPTTNNADVTRNNGNTMGPTASF